MGFYYTMLRLTRQSSRHLALLTVLANVILRSPMPLHLRDASATMKAVGG
jgi:hypothetical protein